MPRSKSMKLGDAAATYRVLSGKHHIKSPSGGGITTIKKGETFESLTDPRETFPNKFELVAGKPPSEVLASLLEEDSKQET